MSRPAWSTPADVVAKVRRRWDSGTLLSAYARGLPFEPIDVPLRGPGGEIAERLDDVRGWMATLEKGSRRRGGATYRLELRAVGGRLLGSNQLPARAWIESYDAWRLLDVEGEVATFRELWSVTQEQQPSLADWVCDHPLRVLGGTLGATKSAGLPSAAHASQMTSGSCWRDFGRVVAPQQHPEHEESEGASHRLSAKNKMTVTVTETSREPKQPRRVLKRKNMSTVLDSSETRQERPRATRAALTVRS